MLENMNEASMDADKKDIHCAGLFSILKESCNIILCWRKMFALFSMLLILPLSLGYLVRIQMSEILFKMVHNEVMLEVALEATQSRFKLANMPSSKWTALILFKIGYFLLFTVVALTSASTVVYNLIYFPKEWKRLLVTFLWEFTIFFAYAVMCLAVLVCEAVLFEFNSLQMVQAISLLGFIVFYFCGFYYLYITMIWHIGCAVSVLEESYELETLRKSNNLMKGKVRMLFAVLLLSGLALLKKEQMLDFLVFFMDDQQGLGIIISIGVLCLILLSVSLLIALFGKTITYFNGKSPHCKIIDEVSLLVDPGVPCNSSDDRPEHSEV